MTNEMTDVKVVRIPSKEERAKMVAHAEALDRAIGKAAASHDIRTLIDTLEHVESAFEKEQALRQLVGKERDALRAHPLPQRSPALKWVGWV